MNAGHRLGLLMFLAVLRGQPVGAEAPATIPFGLFANHVLVPVEIDGKGPFRLILDTGMPIDGVVLFEGPRVDSLLLAGKPQPERGEVCGVGGGGEIPGAILRLPGVELTDQAVMIAPSPWPPAESPHRAAEGIIGLALFDRYVVGIDYEKQLVTFTDPDVFDYEGDGEVLAIPRDEFGIPEITAEVELAGESPISVRLVLDTGASHALSLRPGSHEAIALPDGAVAGVLGRTMYGPVTGHFGRVSRLRLGDLSLENVVTSFPGAPACGPEANKQGNLGNAALQRFHVTIDYATETLVLEPNRRYGEPFEHDMAGMGFARTPQGLLEIERVVPASPATDAGLTPGDVITAIDGRSPDGIDEDTVRRLLRREGHTVALRVRRGREEREVALQLRRMI